MAEEIAVVIIQADAFFLPYRSNYFHSVLFSPPYWGLRKYEGDQGEEPLGLEATPERHIDRMVVILREVRRVLRDDGVVWLNYGDCFATGSSSDRMEGAEGRRDKQAVDGKRRPRPPGYEAGNLMLMPHRLAIALQADGWIVRNDLVWFKRNPMPESVSGWAWHSGKPCDCVKDAREAYIAEELKKGVSRHRVTGAKGGDFKPLPDCPKCHGTGKVGEPVLRKSSWRHTRAHEYIFMLCKSMKYYCNQEAVRERTLGLQATATAGTFHDHDNDQGRGQRIKNKIDHPSGRNPRSVLDVPTAPYKGAHYATFPPKLIAPLIRASVPRRCCPECGTAWAPVIEKGNYQKHETENYDMETFGDGSNKSKHAPPIETTVTEYRPTCECFEMPDSPIPNGYYIDNPEKVPVPGIVLDIFGGSGTTGMVAKELLRRWVVMDISMPYLSEQARIRTRSGSPPTALEGLPLFETGNEG